MDRLRGTTERIPADQIAAGLAGGIPAPEGSAKKGGRPRGGRAMPRSSPVDGFVPLRDALTRSRAPAFTAPAASDGTIFDWDDSPARSAAQPGARRPAVEGAVELIFPPASARRETQLAAEVAGLTEMVSQLIGRVEAQDRTIGELRQAVDALKGAVAASAASAGGATAAGDDGRSQRRIRELQGRVGTLTETAESQLATIADLQAQIARLEQNPPT